MPVERLSSDDAMMLWPDELWPQDIGALLLLEEAALVDSAGAFRADRARAAVEARLHLTPRFRQLLVVPPPRCGGPLWVDAPDFDLEQHVRVAPLPPGCSERELLRVVEELRRRRLDRSRPLWEMWFLPGLADGRIALFVRMHHAIADGMAAMVTIARFLDPTTDTPVMPTASWTPAPRPTAAVLRSDNRRRRARRMSRSVSALLHPVGTARKAASAWPALREILLQRPLPPTSIDRLVGADRTLALVRSRVDVLKVVAHRHGATIDDVLLAAVTGGLRALLIGRGEPVEGAAVRAYVPVSLRSGARRGEGGNLIGQMVVTLPIGASDPIRRLHLIASETAALKARPRPSLGTFPSRGLLGRLFLKLVQRQRVNVVTADIHGPETSLYFGGARLLEVFPMVQLIGTVSLAVGGISYAGRFGIMAVADRDAFPDLELLTAGMNAEVAVLSSAA